MIEKLTSSAKQIGGEIIAMSTLLDKKMDTWSDVSSRPNNLSPTECVGFINKETAPSGLSLIVDIQAPADKDDVLLRTWAIESKLDDDQVERFNNIQLDFTVDYHQARELAKKEGGVTRDDIDTVLHDQSTKLIHVVVSNQSGLNKESQRMLGKRYDLTISELDGHEDTISTISEALNDVLLTLKKSATAEADS